MKYFLLLLFSIHLYAIESDFDCVVVGSSPCCLIEALYQKSLGHRVIVVEQTPDIGGAWKSIDICGISHVDVGCHELGKDPAIYDFLQDYIGCKMVPSGSELYFSKGCLEFIGNLQLLLQKLEIPLLLKTKVDSLYLYFDRQIVEAKFQEKRWTTKKIILSQNSDIKIENLNTPSITPRVAAFPHVYLLIEDPTPPRFTFLEFKAIGATRAMNNTSFVGLEGSGKQLISIQVRREQFLHPGEKFLAELKKQKLVDENAKLLTAENYTYSQLIFPADVIKHFGPKTSPLVEILDTAHLKHMWSFSDPTSLA